MSCNVWLQADNHAVWYKHASDFPWPLTQSSRHHQLYQKNLRLFDWDHIITYRIPVDGRCRAAAEKNSTLGLHFDAPKSKQGCFWGVFGHLKHQYLLKFSLKYVLKKVPKKSLRLIHDVFLNSRIVCRCVLRVINPNVFVCVNARARCSCVA